MIRWWIRGGLPGATSREGSVDNRTSLRDCRGHHRWSDLSTCVAAGRVVSWFSFRAPSEMGSPRGSGGMDGVPLRAQSALAVNALARYVWGLTARRAWQRPARSVLQREGRVLHLPSGWERSGPRSVLCQPGSRQRKELMRSYLLGSASVRAVMVVDVGSKFQVVDRLSESLLQGRCRVKWRAWMNERRSVRLNNKRETRERQERDERATREQRETATRVTRVHIESNERAYREQRESSDESSDESDESSDARAATRQ